MTSGLDGPTTRDRACRPAKERRQSQQIPGVGRDPRIFALVHQKVRTLYAIHANDRYARRWCADDYARTPAEQGLKSESTRYALRASRRRGLRSSAASLALSPSQPPRRILSSAARSQIALRREATIYPFPTHVLYRSCVMYTVEQARGGVVHTPGFTANGPSPPGAHLGHHGHSQRAPPGDITHTRYYPLYSHVVRACAHMDRARARSGVSARARL